MTRQSTRGGFSVVVAIIIIAILSIGGYTALRYSQKHKAEVEMNQAEQEMLLDAKTNVTLGLKDLQNILNSNLGLDNKVQAATATIAQIRADIASASDSVGAEAKAQLEMLDDKLVQLEVEIKSNIDTVQDTLNELGELIDSIEITFETEGEANVNTSEMMENDEASDDESVDNESDSSVSDDTTSSESVSASTTVEVELDAELMNGASN